LYEDLMYSSSRPVGVEDDLVDKNNDGIRIVIRKLT